MRLRRVAINGFKTFARRSEVVLEPGLTAIVGPNGSGKSNFVDAVRWALGETSARELRGARMDEVIYAGGQGRAPMGMARVELTLDNEDGRLGVDDAEVGIGRRVTRGGDSEYRVNGQRTRLRDLERLLSATGLTQNGYAVVAQDDVDAIIHASPAQRRSLVEEAAGVRGLRAAREDALTRVESVEHRLLRLEDLLADAEPRLAELREQAAAATEHNELAERLAELRGSLAREAWRAARGQLRQARHRLAAARSRAGAAAEAEAAFAMRLEAERSALAAAREAQARATAALEALRLEAERATGDVRRWGDRATAAALQRAAARVEADSLADDIAGAEAQLGRLGELAAAAQAQLAAMEGEQAALADVASAADAALRAADDRVATATATLAAAERARADAEAAARDHAGRARILEEAAAGLGSAAAEAVARAERLAVDAAGAERRTRDLDGEVMAAGLAVDQARAAAESAREHAAAAAAAEADAHQRARNASAQAAELRGTLTAALGGGAVARAVEAGELAGRRLADCIRLVEPGDAPAIEAALEWQLGAWVVDDVDAAAGMLDGGGPREEVIRGDAQAPAPVPTPPGVRPAIFSVSAEAGADGALAWSLSHTWLAPDLPAAHAAVQAAGGRSVLPDGRVVTPAGVRGGGRPGETIETAAAEREAAEAAAEAVAWERIVAGRAAAAQRAHGAAAASLEVATARLSAARAEAAEATAVASSLGAAARAEAERAAALTDERAARDEARRAAEEAARRSAAVATEAGVRVTDATDELESARAARAEAAGRLDGALGRLRVHEVDSARALPEAREVQRRLAAARQAVDVATHRARAAALRLITAEGEALVAVARRAEGLAVTEAAASRLAEALEAAERAGPPVIESEAAMASLEVERSQVAVAGARAADECEAAEAELLVAEDRVSELADVVRGDEADEGPEPDADAAERAEREITRLERRLGAMGPVNALAPAQLAGLAGRVERLVADRADLTRSCDDLRGLARHLGADVERRFDAVFGAVAYHFRQLYEELFPGGRATLRLQEPTPMAPDENDDSETGGRDILPGVEILAQPPGKRLQALSLLSGGERALTALAIILALQQVNPSPFYVLDEVDAPLDDANVGRLTRLLVRLSGTQQFIVVTHNHITMAAAASLYGVTMDRDGVSQLLSVRFEDGSGPAPLRGEPVAAAI